MIKNKLKKVNKMKAFLATAIVAAITAATTTALAITGPTAGSFGYDLYDVAVNDMIGGAPGFVGGLAGVVLSASKLSTNWLYASLGILGSTAVLKADTITTSLGYLI
jgi:hypothetical protein